MKNWADDLGVAILAAILQAGSLHHGTGTSAQTMTYFTEWTTIDNKSNSVLRRCGASRWYLAS